jgi:hypothetical protein
MSKSTIIATQEDPAKPGADDWRPAPIDRESSDRATFLKEWSGKDDKPAKERAPATDEDDDLDEDEKPDEDADVEEDAVGSAVAVDTKPKKPAKPAPVEADDEDEKPEDDDSDLDDEEVASAKLDDKASRTLQKQEQRMRQQIDRERETVRAEHARREEALKTREATASAASAKFDDLKKRVHADPLGVLEELGFDDFEYAGKQAYLRTKAATEPAHKEVAARMQKDKQRDAELADVKRKIAEREKADEDARATAATQREIDAYLGSIVTDANKVAKATLTQKLVTGDAAYAKARFAEAAHALWQATGERPTSRQVVIAVEKAERANLRRYGIDPRTLAPTADDTPAKPGKPQPAKAKPTKANGKPVVRTADDDEELVMPSKKQLLNEDWSS